MTAMIQHELRDVLNHSMRDTTSRFAGIQLLEEDAALSDDICTVHTTWEGGHRAVLLMCADRTLFTRLTQTIMHRETVTPKDIEDVATEYFNIICGQIAGGLFRAAHISSRFQIPRFHSGSYLPEGDITCQCVLNYTSGNRESVHLAFLGMLSPEQR